MKTICCQLRSLCVQSPTCYQPAYCILKFNIFMSNCTKSLPCSKLALVMIVYASMRHSNVEFAGNWRQLYKCNQEALQKKAAGLGKRLRAMTQAEVQSRQTKHVEVSLTIQFSSPAKALQCIRTFPPPPPVLCYLHYFPFNLLQMLLPEATLCLTLLQAIIRQICVHLAQMAS